MTVVVVTNSALRKPGRTINGSWCRVANIHMKRQSAAARLRIPETTSAIGVQVDSAMIMTVLKIRSEKSSAGQASPPIKVSATDRMNVGVIARISLSLNGRMRTCG